MERIRKYSICFLLTGCLIFSGGCGFGQKEESADVASEESSISENLFLEDIRDMFPRELEPVEQTDGEHQEYYFKQLSEENQRTYRELLKGILAFETEIYITSTDEQGIDQSFRAMLYDHPEVFWVHNGDVYYKTIRTKHTTFTPAYCCTQEEVAVVEQKMEEAYHTLSSELSSEAGEYEKVQAVYDYVIRNTQYVIGDHDQNLKGVFEQQQAVCAGYAGAVQYLLERLGVESIYVSGDTASTSEGHAWNIVKIDGQYYFVDATNGDQPEFLNQAGEVSLYDYLAPFPTEYSQFCWPDAEFEVPECTATDYNYYVRNGSSFDSYDFETIAGYMRQQLDMGEHLIRFKFTSQEAYQSACEDLLNNGKIEEIARYYLELTGITQLEYHYNQIEDFNTLYFLF